MRDWPRLFSSRRSEPGMFALRRPQPDLLLADYDVLARARGAWLGFLIGAGIRRGGKPENRLIQAVDLARCTGCAVLSRHLVIAEAGDIARQRLSDPRLSGPLSALATLVVASVVHWRMSRPGLNQLAQSIAKKWDIETLRVSGLADLLFIMTGLISGSLDGNWFRPDISTAA